MPYKQKHPCRHPSSPELVESGKKYCEKHVSLHPEYIRSASSRGYTGKWQRVSKAYLRKHPMCGECMKQGRYTKTTVHNMWLYGPGNDGLPPIRLYD